MTTVGLSRGGEAEVYVGRQSDKLQIVAAVQRQFVDPLVFNNGTQSGVLADERDRLRCDFDDFGYVADRKTKVYAGALLDL